MQFFRVREKSMTLAEVLTGARKTYGINLIGGVRRDMLKHQREMCIRDRNMTSKNSWLITR